MNFYNGRDQVLSERDRLKAENARLRAALQEIADADGGEGRVHGSLSWIHGFEAGAKAQGERAKKALGQAYKEQMPANVLLEALEWYRAALEWYADEANYDIQPMINHPKHAYIPTQQDNGERARQALKGRDNE